MSLRNLPFPSAYTWYSSLTLLTLLVLLFRGVNANSEGYAVLGRYCRNRTRYQTLFWISAPSQSPLEALLMYIMDPSTARGFVSNGRGLIQKVTRRESGRFVHRPSLYRLLFLHGRAVVLPGSHCVEVSNPPKHCSLPGYYYRSPPAYFGLDAWWGSEEIHWRAPRHRPTWSRWCPFFVFDPTLTLATSYLVLLRAFATFTPATSLTEVSREYAHILTLTLPSY
jgi:hypothetical protein